MNPVVIVAGTRPELIKLAPVYHAFRELGAPTRLWLTGQHLSLAEAPVEFFGLAPDRSWKTLQKGQSLSSLLSKILDRLDPALAEERPSAVIVQGDTTSALAGAIAAFHRGIPVAHVEAGLRSGDLAAPFPEEMNRKAIDAMARWLFPPTAGARAALAREGRRDASAPTGNTGIDALYLARAAVRRSQRWPAGVPEVPAGARLVVSTSHRRETLGEPMRAALEAMAREIARRDDAFLIHASHPNPEASRIARETLLGRAGIAVVPPLAYPDFVAVLDRASVAVSDSGGLQEEAPSFGIPVLITREVTERPEVLRCGGVLVGTDPRRIARELKRALDRPAKPRSTKKVRTPFGDGKASERIARRVLRDLRRV